MESLVASTSGTFCDTFRFVSSTKSFVLFFSSHSPRPPTVLPTLPSLPFPSIHSEATYDLLKDIPRFRTESRGGIEIDGEEGKKMTYLVTAPPKRLASSRAQQLGNILLG